jgi:hypothetical protein
MPLSMSCHQITEPSPASSQANTVWPSVLDDLPLLLDDLPASWFDSAKVVECRSESRCACDIRAVLIPLDEMAGEGSRSPIPIVLTDISRHGIGFSHSEPMPYRLVQIAFESTDNPGPILVARLQWCRFRSPGIYESGGKIQRVLAAPPSLPEVLPPPPPTGTDISAR